MSNPFRLVRIGLAALLLIWIVTRAGLDSILESVSHINFLILGGALALMLAESLLKASNWQTLIVGAVRHQHVQFRKVLGWYFAGGFLGALIPSSASTDVFRAYLSQRGLGGHGPACAASVFTLNGVGWFAGCLLGLAGFAILAISDAAPQMLYPAAVMFLTMGIILPSAYRMLSKQQGLLLIKLSRLDSKAFKNVARKFIEAICTFQHADVRFISVLAIAILGLLAQAGMYAVTAAAVGVYIPFAVWMILAPLTRMVALIPISVADFGLIQGAHVWLLSMFGVKTSDAFVISSLFALLGLCIHTTAGAGAFVFSERGRVPSPMPSN
jgi:glycosyltransferase 2 family protein